MLLVLAAVAYSLFASARIFNVTIDDTLGDERTGEIPQYAPNWTARSVGGAPCPKCGAQPDATRTLKGTWHDKSTYVKDDPATVSLDFSGTRIYVYFILFNDIGTVNKNTRLRFYLDGSSDVAGDFLHSSDPAGAKYLYNQLAFDSGTLDLGDHTLLVSSYSDGTTGSLALFDYAVYTTVDGPDPHTTQVPQGGGSTVGGPDPQTIAQANQGGGGASSHIGVAIGGSIAGGLASALLLGAAYWICTRRRQRRGRPALARGSVSDSQSQAAIVEPFDARPPASLERGYRERTSKALPVSLRSRDNSDRLRSELGWVREELDRVRRIAEPPDYTRASRESSGS